MIKIFQENKKRKVVLLSATFFCIAAIASSCTKDEDDFGANLQPNGDLLNYEIIDTFSLKTFSVEDDSMRTDETTFNLLGSYVDPVFGKMDCGFVTQVRLEADQPNFGTQNPTADSIVLSFRYAGAYGALGPQNFQVYRITEDISTDEQYYRYTNISFDNNNLVASGQGLITPNLNDDIVVGTDTVSPQLRIPLDPAFGQEIIDQSGGGNLADNDAFTSWMKGLYVKVDNPGQASGEGGVLYLNLLDAVSRMTLYFKDGTESRSFNFLINTNAARLNKIDTDYTGTKVEEVLQNSSEGNEQFFYQAAALRGAIEFPYLMNMKDSFPNLIVNKAELILPIQYTTNDLLVPALNLTVASYNKENNTQSLIFDNFNPNHLDGNYDEENKTYRFVITRYIQNIFKGNIPNDGLRMLSTEHFSSVSRVLFNGQDTDKKKKPYLELTITTY